MTDACSAVDACSCSDAYYCVGGLLLFRRMCSFMMPAFCADACVVLMDCDCSTLPLLL